MPYCDECKKFASLELGEPEVINEPEYADEGVTAEVRIVRSCAECSKEMREYSFDFNTEVDTIHDHPKGSKPEYHAEPDGEPELDELKLGKPNKAGVKKPNKRGTTYFRCTYKFQVFCSCSKDAIYDGEFMDDVRASDMDET
jgi:hypothetical protein